MPRYLFFLKRLFKEVVQSLAAKIIITSFRIWPNDGVLEHRDNSMLLRTSHLVWVSGRKSQQSRAQTEYLQTASIELQSVRSRLGIHVANRSSLHLNEVLCALYFGSVDLHITIRSRGFARRDLGFI